MENANDCNAAPPALREAARGRAGRAVRLPHLDRLRVVIAPTCAWRSASSASSSRRRRASRQSRSGRTRVLEHARERNRFLPTMTMSGTASSIGCHRPRRHRGSAGPGRAGRRPANSCPSSWRMRRSAGTSSPASHGGVRARDSTVCGARTITPMDANGGFYFANTSQQLIRQVAARRSQGRGDATAEARWSPAS